MTGVQSPAMPPSAVPWKAVAARKRAAAARHRERAETLEAEALEVDQLVAGVSEVIAIRAARQPPARTYRLRP